jgi:hypothetical protein
MLDAQPGRARMTNGAQANRGFGERLLAAFKLEPELYEEVEHDPTALAQAAGVVALAAVARGIGFSGMPGAGGLVGGIVGGFLGWFVGTALIWAVGVWWFKHTSDYGELLRTLGFASAPQLLYVVAVIPFAPLQVLVALLVAALSVAAWVIAVRQALDVSTGRAVAVCVIAILLSLSLSIVFGGLFARR